MVPRTLVAGGLALLLVVVSLSLAAAQRPAPKIGPELATELAEGPAEFLVVFARQADLSPADRLPGRAARTAWVVGRLQQAAAAGQAPLRALLEERGVPARPFWIVNALLVQGDADLARLLSARPEVARLVTNRASLSVLPRPQPLPPGAAPLAVASVEWNVVRVGAVDVWETYGVHGEGVVVADNDTGVRWDHEALKEQYRGWDTATDTVNHDYAWHDAFGQHLAPYDDHGHGTHTTGTMVGDNQATAGDGATRRQVGVAPGARWIACRNMSAGVGSPASYLDCFEWLLAPTRSDGSEPQPALAPDIINNSWACTSGEGCTNDQLDVLRSAAAAVRAAGILNVVSAGNGGNTQCGTISEVPTIYPEVFSVGATANSSDALASFSSIGPVIRDGSQRFKPDLVAPGQSVVSSINWSASAYASMNGTSMATPAVSGVAALMLSAAPQLSGKVALIERILRETARPLTTTATVSHPGGACLAEGAPHPNLLYGWGLVDARAAVAVALSCPRADFDGSGAVDVRDPALQTAAWHRPVDTLTQGFDLNQDGAIDIVDFSLASAEWLAACQFPNR